MTKNYQQKITFKPKPEAVLEEFAFDGGLVTDVHETKLKPNQSPNLGDVLFNTSGSVTTRDGYDRYNTNPIGTASDQSNTGASAGTVNTTAPSQFIAQTFQPSGTISVTQVDLYIAMNTSGIQQYVQVQLWATSAGVPTTILTNGTGQIQQISGTSETAYNFRFRQPVILSASTTYAIVLIPFVRGTTQTSNQVNVHRTGSAYANGQVYITTDSGLNWSAAGNDLKFVVYSGGDTGATGLIRYYGDNSIQQQLVKFGSVYYRGNDGTGALTTISMGNSITPNATNFIDSTVVNGTLLVVDDSNYILKYRGSTNAPYTTGTISVSYGHSTVTGVGTTWNTLTNVEVGEYIQLPDSKWYKITSISNDGSLLIEINYYGTDATGQSYVISPWGVVQGRFNDGATVPSSELITNLVRPQPKCIVSHLNRVWTLDGNELRFSALDTSITGEHFNNWDTSNNAGEIIIPSDSGDVGTALYSLNGYLYIFQKHAIWELLGSAPSNFQLRNISNEVGTTDRKTLVEYDRYLFFFDGKDIQFFDGVNLKNLTGGVVRSLIGTWANITSPSATLWDNKYLLSYTESGQTANDSVLFYDITRSIFGKFTNVFASVWCNWNGGSDMNQVVFASSNQGSIYTWASGLHDDGYQIETLYDMPSLGFEAGINDKTLKRFFIQQTARGNWTMDMTMFIDINEIQVSGEPIDLSPGIQSLWDIALWDVDVWSGEGELITTRVAEFQGLGKYFKVRFSQTGFAEGIEVIAVNGTARVRRLN